MTIEGAQILMAATVVSRTRDIRVGWTAERVRRAFGIPSRITSEYGAVGPEEVWHYGTLTVRLARGVVVAVR